MKNMFEKSERRHKGKNGMSCYFIKGKYREITHRDYSKLFHLERTCRGLANQSSSLLEGLISLLYKKKKKSSSISRTILDWIR